MTSGNANIEAIYPLTPVQDGILFHALYAPESPLYFQQYVCTIAGPLDADVFRRAWQLIIDRHPPLRSLLTWEGRDQPLQIVRRTAEPEWTVEDWSDRSPEEQEDGYAAFLAADRSRGFRLDVAPLMRFALLRTGDDIHRFVWSHHHVIVDGWSMGLVLEEVFGAYEAMAEAGEPELGEPAPYRDYVRWLKAQDLHRAETFWRAELDGFGAATSPRLGESRADGRWAEEHLEEVLRLSAEDTARLVDFARTGGFTLSTVLRAAWALVVGRYSGADDVVFGTTFAGRPHDLDGSLEMVGLFINTLPVRIRLDGDEPLSTFLGRIQQRQIDASPYESTPLVEVQGWSSVPKGEPLFETLLVVENVPNPGTGSSRLHVSDVRYLQRSNYPLAVLAMPGDRLELIFLYDAQRYSGEHIRRMSRQMERVLTSMVDHSSTRVGDLEFFPEDELREIVHGWNDTAAAVPEGRLIQGLIGDVVRASPLSVAVRGSGVDLTYAELAERAEEVSRWLLALGIRPDDRVAVAMERSPGMLVAILGVLGAGGGYVPLDPGLPAARIALLLAETDAKAIIVGAGGEAPGDADLPARTLDVAGLETAPDRPGAAGAAVEPAPDAVATEDDLAYVMFTSGSTGRPKGVEVTHRNLVSSTSARLLEYGEPVGTFLLLSPFVFDSSVAGVFSTLTQGGTLVLPAPRMEQDVHHLAQLIAANSVTHTLALPSVYSLLLEHAAPTMLESLRLVMVAGEACPPELVAWHARTVPHARLVNEYGPTEATVWCTVHHAYPPGLDATQPRVPIGKPIANTVAHILDGHGRPTPVGVSGELHIGGRGLARGYLNRPELTAGSFVVRDIPLQGATRLYRTGDVARYLDDGTIDLIGRLDRQIKIRGQRIELGEIEAALQSFPGVREAAVTVLPGDGSNGGDLRPAATLVGYVEGPVDPEEVRGFVAARLPNAMVPAVVVALDALPRGGTGKLDRSALPEPTADRGDEAAAYVAPDGDVERRLADIWLAVLGVDRVGATDNFFELGGDSILSIRIIARAHKAGLVITPKQFFDHPTIAGLAAVVSQKPG